MIILVDMDDVLADFDGGFLLKWREKYPDEFFIPMSERQNSICGMNIRLN